MTKRMFTLSVLAAIAVAAGVLPSPAYAATKLTSSRSQTETWSVVQIGDEFKAIRSSDLKSEKKRVADQYKADIKKWEADKIKDPDAPRPPRLFVRVRKTNIDSQEAAKNYCDKFQEELDKKNEGKDSSGDKPKAAGKSGG